MGQPSWAQELLARAGQLAGPRAVVLSPVVQPWYAAWGFVFLAPVVEGAARRAVVIFSGVTCFVGLPGAKVLVRELGVANPLLVGAAVVALLGIVAVILLPRLRRGRQGEELGATAT